ncbi:MAG: hypothetical protein FWB71_06925 [Defluviitaleaceae bacterium]|nr:hypothetical protein [Defluviitaleaceae bacterium]
MANKQIVDIIDNDFAIDENWAEDDGLIDLPGEIIAKLLAEGELIDNAPGARRYSHDEFWALISEELGYEI